MTEGVPMGRDTGSFPFLLLSLLYLYKVEKVGGGESRIRLEVLLF